MNIAVLSVGDELVLGTTLDTNSQTVARALLDVGGSTMQHRTVGDDLDAIARALRDLAETADVVVVTGGLGPTADDLTRDALNVVLDSGAPMLEDAARRHELRAWFEGRGRVMPSSNARQALHPRSARTIPNPHGTAPGLAAKLGRAHVFCLPGPPREMEPMLRDYVVPVVASTGHAAVVRRAVQTFGLGESNVAELLGERMMRGLEPAVGTTASQSIVTVQIVARGGASAQPGAGTTAERAAKWERECAALLAPYAFGGADATLGSALLSAAAEAGLTIAVAESCTAGMVGAAIAAVPGSSAQFVGGWLTYSNDMKVRELAVPESVLLEHGAVSAQCARAMAEGAALRSGASLAIAITGIAGPSGGSSDKPVGTVFIAVHQAARSAARSATAQASTAPGAPTAPFTFTRRFHFPGPRDTVRDRATKAALQLARWTAMGVEAPMIWEVA